MSVGKGSGQTIGFRYLLGVHSVLCLGPIDKITRFDGDSKPAWSGAETGGSIVVDAPNLFGGDNREGGLSGTIDIAMGLPDQLKNDYLLANIGSAIPAFRGVVSAIFRQFNWGNNPYLKPYSFRAQRIHVRQNGIAQWYDAKAAIGSDALPPLTSTVSVSWFQSTFEQTLNDQATMGIAFLDASGVPIGSTTWAPLIDTPSDPTNTTGVWTARSISAVPPSGAVTPRIYMQMGKRTGVNNDGYIDDIVVTIGGASAALINPGAEDGTTTGWTNELGAITVRNSAPLAHSGTYYFTGGGAPSTLAYQDIVTATGEDMNPAHIIRECLTDPIWGMGYTDDDIDDASFTSAADVLYDEQMGISLLWDKETKIEDFVNTVLRHADAALYVSRTTGRYVLKLIRGDYDESTLISLDESNIQSVDSPSKIAYGELTNSVTVTYWDRVTGKDATVSANDPALLQQQGVLIDAPVQYPGFTNSRNATIAAQRDLRVLSSPLLSCTILADATAKPLNFGDVFKFSWAEWGEVESVMRVTGIAYGTGRNNRVKINCTRDVFDTETTLTVISTSTGWVDPSGVPSVVPEQIAFEAPYYEIVQRLGQDATDAKLTAANDIGFVAAAGTRPLSGINANLYTDSGAGYANAGVLNFCPSGELTTDLTKTQTNFVLTNASDLDEVTLGTHFQIGDELMRVDTVNVVTGAITVGRGVLDTVPHYHTAGDTAFFWDEYAGFDGTEYVLGEEVDAKIVTASGRGVLPIAEAIPMTVDLAQRAWLPYAPGDLRINGESYNEAASYNGELAISWKHRDRLLETSGTLIDHTSGNIGPEAGTAYRVRGYIDNVLVHTEDDIAGTSTTWLPTSSGLVRVEVNSKRDGVYSLQAASHTFLNAISRLVEDGDTRYTEDGLIRVIEG